MIINTTEDNLNYFLLFSSSTVKISSVGSLNVFLFAMFFSNDNNKAGSNNKFDAIANNKVIETNPPNAMVPPKLDTVNTKKPKYSTIEV